MNIFVANLNYSVQEGQLGRLFEGYGEVNSVKIITDKHSGRSKGFGFVEMENEDEGQAAIEALNGSEFEDRELVVKKARPRE